MPFSSDIFDHLFANVVAQVRPQTVVDIGAGAGKYGKIVRRVEELCNFKAHTTAVEIDAEYVQTYALPTIYDDVRVLDASLLWQMQPGIKGDLCILGDFIEHLPKSAGIDLINYLLYRFSVVLVAVPLDLFQEQWRGHAQEAHVSLWYESDFLNFKGISIIKRMEGSVQFMLVCMNGVCTATRDHFKIVDDRDKVFLGYPYRALTEIAFQNKERP